MSGNQTRIETHPARLTAEALALPQMVCRRRSCRRRNRCGWIFKENGEPCCLRNLTAEQRQIFDQVYREALSARDTLGHVGIMFASRDVYWRDLEDAGVEIARNVVPAYDKARWARFRREREKLPPAVEGDWTAWARRQMSGGAKRADGPG